MTCSIIAWQMKNPRTILLCYVPSSLFWSCQYFLLNAPAAVVTCILSALKDSILSCIPAALAKYLIAFFIILLWIVGLPLVSTPLHILPLLTMTAFNLALIQPDNRGLMSRVNILCQIAWFVFNASVGAWMGVACSIFVISSAMTGMARFESWEIGTCYRTFLPSIHRALFNFSPRTSP